MKRLIYLNFRIAIPSLVVYALLIVSPTQLNSNSAQISLIPRVFIVIVVSLFSWFIGNTLTGETKKQMAKQMVLWETKFGTYVTLNRFGVVISFLGIMAFPVIFSVFTFRIITDYLPEWIPWRVIITTFIFFITGIGLIKYNVDNINLVKDRALKEKENKTQ